LFGDLLDDHVIALGGQGKAGDLGIYSLGDRKALDIKTASAEKSGDPGEDPGLVLQED